MLCVLILNNILSNLSNFDSKESQAKLGPLQDILDSLNRSFSRTLHVKSQSLSGLQTERLSPMSRTYSMPRDSECKMYRKNLAASSKLKSSANISLYKDAPLSSAQDYVSGCSLIAHTPLKPKSSMTNRTKGRAAEHKFRFWSSGRLGKSSQDANLSVDQSSFIRSSSFHGRSSREEKIYLSSSRSFDTGSRPKNLSLGKSDLRLKAMSDPPELVPSKTSMENLRSSAEDISLKGRSHTFATFAKSASSSMLQDMTLDGDKTIRRLPDIIHESVTWDDITHQPDQPLYFSPATEPMTPLGNRQFRFGFGFANPDDDSSYEAEDTSTSRRGLIKTPYPKSSLALNNDSNSTSSQITIRVSDAQHPAIPISYNTWSSKSSDSDSLNRSGNFASSLQELNSTERNSAQQSSEPALNSEGQAHSASVNVLFRMEDNLEIEDQCKPHSDSILSGYSSICSDQERGSVCSFETCSCTSSEDPENTGHHNHHKRTRSMKQRPRPIQLRNGSLYDGRPR